LNTGDPTVIEEVRGETFVGASRLFSSATRSPVSTVAVPRDFTEDAPASLISRSRGAPNPFTNWMSTSLPGFGPAHARLRSQVPNLGIFGEVKYNFVSDVNQLKIMGGFTYNFIY
jgi:hypothetical protein